MTDEIETEEESGGGKRPHGPLCGERLVEARRARQIPVVEIAKELHLDEHKIRALEGNDFDVIGAPVFVKGHLRKYAQLVGVDVDDVLADYYKLNRSQGIPPVIAVRPKPRREFSLGPWIVLIVVVLIAAAGYWILVTRPFEGLLPAILDGEPGRAGPSAELPSGGDAAPPAEAVVDEAEQTQPAAEAEAEPAPAQPEPAQAAREEPPRIAVDSVTPPPPVAEGEVRLSVTFTGDCWTEISDSTGRRLFFNLGRSGATIEVAGQAPLSVLFGNADYVQLMVNGSGYTIADADRRGRTASFQIDGD